MAKDPTKDMRVFGIAMAVVFGGIGVWQLVKDRTTVGTVLVVVSVLFAVAAVFAVGSLKPLYGPWMKFAAGLGFVMTRVILTIFYFLVLAPFGVVRRVLGKDGLDQKLDDNAVTHWKERDPTPPARERYERQF